MELRLYKMGPEAKVAVANLLLLDLLMVLMHLMAQPGEPPLDAVTPPVLAALALLTFPVGWVAWAIEVWLGPPPLPLSTPVFVILNAYFWGYAVAAIRRRWWANAVQKSNGHRP